MTENEFRLWCEEHRLSHEIGRAIIEVAESAGVDKDEIRNRPTLDQRQDVLSAVQIRHGHGPHTWGPEDIDL